MGYYEKTKAELETLLDSIRREKEHLEIALKQEQAMLDKEASRNNRLREGVIQMAKERQVGFPWLTQAYDELFALEEYDLANFLVKKKHAAVRAAEIIKEQSHLRREAEQKRRAAEYIVEYYETIAPFLLDLKEEVDMGTEQDAALLREFSEEELHDQVTSYLTKEEYRRLPSLERNQMALDRFWKRSKSKWLIGRLYERYIGYLYEQQGYDVEYVGIFKGFEDLGRDLICHKGRNMVVIQCKYWSKFRTIYEKHIFQFFGTVFQFRDENPDKAVTAVFYTTTQMSALARRFADELGISLKENFPFDPHYPCIKCHTSKSETDYASRGTKIYHLPFDQLYDKTRIEKRYGEFYCRTVKEAEDAGFRRALRHRQQSES